MTAPTISEYLKFVNLQMAAESLFGFNAYTANGSLIPGNPSTEPLTNERLTTGKGGKRGQARINERICVCPYISCKKDSCLRSFYGGYSLETS